MMNRKAAGGLSANKMLSLDGPASLSNFAAPAGLSGQRMLDAGGPPTQMMMPMAMAPRKPLDASNPYGSGPQSQMAMPGAMAPRKPLDAYASPIYPSPPSGPYPPPSGNYSNLSMMQQPAAPALAPRRALDAAADVPSSMQNPIFHALAPRKPLDADNVPKQQNASRALAPRKPLNISLDNRISLSGLSHRQPLSAGQDPFSQLAGMDVDSDVSSESSGSDVSDDEDDDPMILDKLFGAPPVARQQRTSEGPVGIVGEAYGSKFMPPESLISKDDLEHELKALQALHLAGFLQEVQYESRKMELLRLKKFSTSTSVKHTEYTHLFSSASIATHTSNTAKLNTNRNVRIFVSSTFRDMSDEREQLLKNVFPQLQRIGRERGIFITAVDLRWGITEEQSNTGETINICLSEVDRCRPYFIALLGSRYGWASSPDGKLDDLLKKTFDKAVQNFNWIRKFSNRSVTELEIRHAVLNNLDSNTSSNSRFYLKRSPTRDDDARLTTLKAELRQESQLKVKDYDSPTGLAAAVLKDIMDLLDQDFPLRDVPTPLEREQMAHLAFQESRARVYIGRQNYFQAINAHLLTSGAGPMTVVGESGSGKSAFMCNWTARYKEEFPERLVIAHYIGSTAASADLGQMLRRIMSEISAFYRIDKEIPSDLRGMIDKFGEFLTEAGSRGGITLVLDALNQLDPRDNSHDLKWLPQVIPDGVRLVLSTLPSRCLDEVTRRAWTSLRIMPLTTAEQEAMIQEYLAQYAKKLTPAQLSQIMAAPQCSNPLYLRTLLEELRVFGSFEQLNSKISHYLTAKDPPSLFQHVFSRLEAEIEPQTRKGIIGDVLSLIIASRKGLTESELLGVLKLTPALWSPIFLALEESLVSRSGYLAFFHDYLRQAVEARYVSNAGLMNKYRAQLITYFTSLESSDPQRMYEEVPYQLDRSGSMQQLFDFITHPPHFKKLCSNDFKFDLYFYWRRFPSDSSPESQLIKAMQAAQASVTSASASEVAELIESGANFFKEMGLYVPAEALYQLTIKVSESYKLPDKVLAERLEGLGYTLRLRGRYKEAEPVYKKVLTLKERLYKADDPILATAINSLAILYRKMGRYKEAEELYLRALDIRKKRFGSEPHPDIAQSLNSLGCLNQDMGRYEESEGLFNQAVQMRELLLGSTHPDLAMSLYNRGCLYLDWNRYPDAEPNFLKSLEIYKSVFGEEHPYSLQSLSSIAGLKQEMGRYKEAEKIYARVLTLKEKVLGNEHPELALTCNDLAVLYARLNRLNEAERLYKRALEIRRKVVGENHPDTAQAIKNLASNLQDQGRFNDAIPLFQQALSITEDSLGREHPNTASALTSLAGLFNVMQRYSEALSMYERALKIYEGLADGRPDADLALTLNDVAVLYFKQSNFPKAEEYYLKSLDTYERCLGHTHPDVAQALSNIGHFHKTKGDKNKAAEYFQRSADIFQTNFGANHEKTQRALANLASCK